MVSPLPFSGSERGMTFTIVGQPAPAQGMEPSASHLTTDGNYFRAMRIPLEERPHLRGARSPGFRAGHDDQPSLCRKIFRPSKPALAAYQHRRRSGAAVSQHVKSSVSSGTAKHGNLAEPESPEFYIPFAQDPDNYMDIVVRTSEPRRAVSRR